MIKPPVNETKWSSLLARASALILYISIWIFDFRPEKLPGLSRNGPLMFIFFLTPLFIIQLPPPSRSSLRKTSSWQCASCFSFALLYQLNKPKNSVNIITKKCLSKDSLVGCWLLHKIDLQNRIMDRKRLCSQAMKILRSERRIKIFRSVILRRIKKHILINCFWTKNWLPRWRPAPNIPTFF